MTFAGRARRCAIGILLCASMSGCFPVADSQLDEKKEPNFLKGETLVRERDYQGAIDAFDKALEANPHSASAHFELACLYDTSASDPAAAIYHFRRYLKYAGNPGNADVVNQRINVCEQELAKNVSAVGPQPSPAQREMERVTLENRDLQAQVAELRAQLAQAKLSAGRLQTPGQSPPAIPRADPRAAPLPAPKPAPVPASRVAGASALRTHVVKAGENPAAIARKYGISVNALLAANPQMKPTHLLVGQVLNVPAP